MLSLSGIDDSLGAPPSCAGYSRCIVHPYDITGGGFGGAAHQRKGVCVGCAIRPSVRFNTAARRGSPAVYSGAFFIDVLSNHHRPGEVGSVNLTAWFDDDSAQCRLNAV